MKHFIGGFSFMVLIGFGFGSFGKRSNIPGLIVLGIFGGFAAWGLFP